MPAGPVALVTHSGSVFSALLRTRRAFGFTLAVSSGQELVTPAAAYARYALTLPETKVLAFVLETIRDAPALRAVLADAAARDVPVLLLTGGRVGGEPLAGRRPFRRPGGGRRRLAGPGHGLRRPPRRRPGGTGRHPRAVQPRYAGRRPAAAGGRQCRTGRRVPARQAARPAGRRDRDRARLRLRARARRGRRRGGGRPVRADQRGDEAAARGGPRPGPRTGQPARRLGDGPRPRGPVHRGAVALADDPGVGAVALAVDLVPEYDGDDSYRTPCSPPPRKPRSRSPSSPRSPPRSTRSRDPCAPPGSPSSSRPALASWPSATCSPSAASRRRALIQQRTGRTGRRCRAGLGRIVSRGVTAGWTPRAARAWSARARGAARCLPPLCSPCSVTTASPRSRPARPRPWTRP